MLFITKRYFKWSLEVKKYWVYRSFTSKYLILLKCWKGGVVGRYFGPM